MITVLPTPAPPNSPTLPPFAYGAKRSTTLIPVSKISLFVLCSSNGGGSLWIDHFVSNFSSAPSSIKSPTTLKILPKTFSPTGTLIGVPRAVASNPLVSPSLISIAIVLTLLSPRCAAVSKTSLCILPSTLKFTSIASLILGK